MRTRIDIIAQDCTADRSKRNNGIIRGFKPTETISFTDADAVDGMPRPATCPNHQQPFFTYHIHRWAGGDSLIYEFRPKSSGHSRTFIQISASAWRFFKLIKAASDDRIRRRRQKHKRRFPKCPWCNT